MSEEHFEKLHSYVIDYLNNEKELYITDNRVGAHPKHNQGVRVITTSSHHALFSNYLFRKLDRKITENDFTVLHAPDLKIDPEIFETRSDTVIVTCLSAKLTIITGTHYAGEIKKSMFSVMNYFLPDYGVLPMHSGSSTLENKDKDVSIFFGLSGTGKTTLSTDEGTLLIGDDEHGLCDDGIFNFEGGCYAKTYQLSAKNEPDIFKATNSFGALIENVMVDPKTGEINFNDKSITENGRSSYPLSYIKNHEPTSAGKIPKHIFFLTADAFGVLPPVSFLNFEQALSYFVLGYTSKLAGTEMGITKPQTTFSPCFGAPFMLRHPKVYAELLGHYLSKYDIKVWLINTGWIKGAYGVGERISLPMTRDIIRSIQAGELNNAPMEMDPIFKLMIPKSVRNIEPNILNPAYSWADKEAYKHQATELYEKFETQMKALEVYELLAKYSKKKAA
jgi:phosphoenolpyruvate carboxykinase (ATP)